MFKLFAVLLLPLAAFADERWIEFRSGPFQVLTSAGDRSGREALNNLEQFRYALGKAVGNDDLKTTWPVRVLVSKSAQAVPPALARDTYTGALAANAPIPPGWFRGLARILIDSNCARMPAPIEAGIEAFYSTIEINGTKMTLGRPPGPSELTLDWARIHMLQVLPDYYGKVRVLLFNLQRGVEMEPAFRNAFAKTPQQIEEQAKAYLAAGNFQVLETSGRPLDARRDFTGYPAKPPLPEVAQADLAGKYEALRNAAPAEAHEGLGLADLKAGRNDEARKEFEAAVSDHTTSARAWYELARLANDPAKAHKAAELNPNWAAPHVWIASAEKQPARKLAELQTAAKLEPRNAAYWRALAEADIAANKFGDASKAWAAAENASVDDAERDQIRAARRKIEEQRLDYEAAERRRREEERQREIQQLKDKAMAQVRAAEQRANEGQAAAPANRKTVNWEDLPHASGSARGKLVQIDCLGGPARLVIQEDGGGRTRLLIRDPSRVAVLGGGELQIRCGPQRAPRIVSVEFYPKKDARHGTSGEVSTIEYVTPAESQPQPEERKRLPKQD